MPVLFGIILSDLRRFRMKNRKRALIFPTVMVFFFLSQLIYVRLLSVQSKILHRNQSMIDYCQTHIQANIAKNILSFSDEDLSLEIEDHILGDISELSSKLIIKYPWLKRMRPEDLSGWLDISNSSQPLSLIVLYHYEIFLPQEQAEYCNFFDQIRCSGVLDRNYLPNYKELDEFVTHTDSLPSDSYHEIKQISYNQRGHWDKIIDLPLTLDFNQGRVIIESKNLADLQIMSALNSSDFVLNDTFSLPSCDYLIIWKARIMRNFESLS